MKVFVLGHKGMLGHVVARYLAEQGMQVLSSNHRYTGLPNDPLIAAIRNSRAPWVVNAVGKVDAKYCSPSEMLLANTQFPIHVASFLLPDQRLIHASSDGVFSGREGNYGTNSNRDADDIYGFSKLLAEVIASEGRIYVIRTSIIGPPGTGGTGLLEWFLAQQHAVHGYTNHLWNGITTLEWSKIVWDMITGNLPAPAPLFQPTCANPVSKYTLLNYISEVWNHRVPVVATETGTPINRTLLSDLRRAPIKEQLLELREWWLQKSQ